MLDLRIEMLKLQTFPEKYPYGYSEGAFNDGISIEEYNEMEAGVEEFFKEF